jgi:cellulose synthase (UDP-forming)
VGTAPSTAAGLAKQHLTWAIDSLRILFFDSPLTKRGLTLRQRAHYVQTTTQYLTAIPQVAFWIAPFMYLLLHLSAIRGSEVGVAFAATAVPYYGTVLVWLALFIGVRDTLRTAAQRTFLAPVFVVAAIGAVLGRPGARSVTDKVGAPRFSLLLVPMAALLALTVLALGYGATVADPRMTIGMAFAAGTTFLMLGVSTAMTPRDRFRRRLRAHAAALTALVVLVFLVRAF